MVPLSLRDYFKPFLVHKHVDCSECESKLLFECIRNMFLYLFTKCHSFAESSRRIQTLNKMCVVHE